MANPDPDCPLCHGSYPDDLVERIKSAKPMGEPMSAEQFMEWLKALPSGEDRIVEEEAISL